MAFTLNTTLLPVKAHYFLYHCATASIMPFLVTYARQLGFSTVAVGMITMAMAIASLVLRPLSGFIADKFRVRKSLLLTMLVLIASVIMCIHFVHPDSTTVTFERRCDGTAADTLQYCPDVEPHNECLLEQLINQRADGRMQCMLKCRSIDATSEKDLTLNIGLDDIQPVERCQQFAIHNDATTNASCQSQQCRGTCTNRNVFHLLASNLAETRISISANMSLQLWLFVVCMTLCSALSASIMCLGNSWCFELLDDKPHLYGKQRLWGSMGWGIVSLLSGLLVDRMSRGQALKDYSGAFYLMLGFMACDLLAAALIPQVQSPSCPSIVASISRLFLQPRILVFFSCFIVAGMFTSVTRHFLFWHLEELAEAAVECEIDTDGSVMDHGKTLQGLVSAVQTFGGEIPMFYLSGAVLKRIGHVHAISLVLGTYGVRFLLYSVLRNPWWTLPVELLQGLTTGIFMTTMPSYASKVAPSGAVTTLQGMAGAIYEGCGFSLGGLIGGYAMERLGGSAMFFWFGCGALALCAVHVITQLVLDRVCPEIGMLHAMTANGDVTEDILSANLAEQRNELNHKHKYSTMQT